ncbi:RNA polymerase sigma factor [Streptomyces chartreusis]
MTGAEDSSPPARPSSFRELDTLWGIHYEQPPGFAAFYDRCARPHWQYAAKVLGDKSAGRDVVRALYTHLALNWDRILLEERSPESFAWRALKLRIETHARIAAAPAAGPNGDALQAKGSINTIHDAVRATLWEMRSELAAADSPIGLYAAIATLPARQFDVMILNYVMGYTCSYIADIMGLNVSTVRSHRRQARKHLAAKLRIHLRDDREKE